MKTANEILSERPSIKQGLDDFYGYQTVINAMEEYAQQQVKLLSIKQFTFDCWFKDSGRPMKRFVYAANESDAIKSFEDNNPDMGYDYPYDVNE